MSDPALHGPSTARPSAPPNAARLGPEARGFWSVAFDAIAQGVAIFDPDGRMVFANRAAAEQLGYPSAEALIAARPEGVLDRFELLTREGAPFPLERLPSRRAVRERAGAEETLVFRERHSGRERVAVVRGQPVFENGRLAYVVNTFRDISQQAKVEDGLRFLVEASRILASSLDTDKTLDAVARLVVPRLADWCAIELVEDGKTVGRQVAVAHVDPEKVKWAHALRDRYPPQPDAGSGVPHVLRTGEPELYEEIPDELLAQSAVDAEHLRISRELGLKSAVIVPLKARGRTLGALTLVQAESRRRFSPADLELLMGLAARAALAVENARLFEESRRNEQRAVLALDAGKLGTWEWDIRSGRVRWSEILEQIRGMKPGSFQGDFAAHLADVHPEDRARVHTALTRAVEDKRPYFLEYRIVRPDGQVRWLESHGGLTLAPDGTPLTLTGMSADITERRQSEETGRRLLQEQTERALAEAAHERITRILDSITDPFVAVDPEWRITFINAAAAAVYGTSRDLLVGKRVDALQIHPSLRALFEQLREAREENRPRVFEHFDPRSNAWFNVHVYPFEGGLSIYARDITARRQAEEALARHTAELARSNAELERFAYVASHDLQEPLRMVASYTQLLARRYKGKLDSDADEFIHFAVDGVTRMQQLINDLLAYSRVGTRGKEFQPVPVARAVDRALLNLEMALQESGARVERGELPTLEADEAQLTQLFQNLIGNALKFRSAEPPRVEISATREEGGWHFAVKDNGIGIDPQYFERIFIIFQRLHGKREYPGTGIGLAICKKIVERHGGRIWVESASGQGSAFHFLLPTRPVPSPGGRLS